jgi:hypothetical protein
MWNKFLYLFYDIFYIVWFSPKKDLRKANNYNLLYFTLSDPKLNHRCSFVDKHESGHYLSIQRSFHALCKGTHSSTAVEFFLSMCRTFVAPKVFLRQRGGRGEGVCVCVRSPRWLGATISAHFRQGVLQKHWNSNSHKMASYDVIGQYTEKEITFFKSTKFLRNVAITMLDELSTDDTASTHSLACHQSLVAKATGYPVNSQSLTSSVFVCFGISWIDHNLCRWMPASLSPKRKSSPVSKLTKLFYMYLNCIVLQSRRDDKFFK